ncbi:hypothetical protein [Sphingomonas astaxanthinifaciens]|uniref:Uncharacterized protein n=1 Tax=Sphingomonas astaxanthinifaciens DSM 22298 TaxID=1123267 RepID=A0ABQ5Z364_9SPHN|nr:hypothetical protein [Sphingomonas astaxanthinifaciens]GLR46399.1 hypothetical protein GCM10007925_01100 [Sphingomonas astaxanthinifaciens DSM 22298]
MFLFAITAAGLAPTGAAIRDSRDLEVVGRLVENVGYRSLDIPDDVLGHGWITAKFRITRVLHGRAPSRLVTIRYFAHAALVKNVRMKVRLRPADDGSYTLCAPPGENGPRCADQGRIGPTFIRLNPSPDR